MKSHFMLSVGLTGLRPTFGVALPDGVAAGDILISEVLSNPRAGGVDFLEIFNHSDKTIDLSQVSIAGVSTNGVVGNPQRISDYPLFIRPREYKVLTRRPEVVTRDYPRAIAATFIEMATLPDLHNEEGGVVIYSRERVIDSLLYTDTIQSPCTGSKRCVSVEP